MMAGEARSAGTRRGTSDQHSHRGNASEVSRVHLEGQRPPTPLEVFLERCKALALLCRYGGANLIESVDRLQEYAEASGLVEDLGVDWVQAQMAVFFKDVPR